MLKVVADEAAHEDLGARLDEIVREGARRMLAAALEDEVAAHAAESDENGRRRAVRNCHARPRQVSTVAGAIEVTAPRVNAGGWMRPAAGACGSARRFCR